MQLAYDLDGVLLDSETDRLFADATGMRSLPLLRDRHGLWGLRDRPSHLA